MVVSTSPLLLRTASGDRSALPRRRFEGESCHSARFILQKHLNIVVFVGVGPCESSWIDENGVAKT